MYLRVNRKTVKGADYRYWTLVESVRTGRGPRQRVVASLGKSPDWDDTERVGWEEIGRILAGRPRATATLWTPEPEAPDWATVDLGRVSVERVRQFGAVFLGLAVWRRLGLDEAFAALPLAGREEIGWGVMACVLALARFCAPGSDLAVAERWYGDTALDELLGVPCAKINDDRLYRALDRVLPQREAICRHLQQRYGEWFGTKVDFLLYDVTSTYFEGLAAGNPQARRGYSRDHRPDCTQVCIGLVLSREGLPLAYEVFAGDRPDVTTLDEMLALMEGKYGRAGRVWVFDRGIAAEDNLQRLRDRGAAYLVGTPRGWLKRFERDLLDAGWTTVREGLEVKTVPHPDGGTDTFILCCSRERRAKEEAMLARQVARLEAKLLEVQNAIHQGRVKSAEVAGRRLGRWQGRFPAADRVLEAELVLREGCPVDLVIHRRAAAAEWARLAQGAYLLRTNQPVGDPAEFWHTYMHLCRAEQAFRVSKSDLGLRPVWHQKPERVQAHIFICFLALAMWRSLELWMEARGLGGCARLVLEQVSTVRSLDVVLPVRDRSPVRLRLVGRPEPLVAELLHRLGLALPNRPKRIANVVENSGPDG